jgi:2-polyprenyl-6-methoxyphenol hydroxylase-like FAD-dependent oxidoreductase
MSFGGQTPVTATSPRVLVAGGGIGEVTGETMKRMEWPNARGRFLAAWNVGDLGRKLGAPAVGLVRSQLQAALAARVEDGVVRAQSELVDFEQRGPEVVARFTDGREEREDVLVGADGLHSLVRAKLHGLARRPPPRRPEPVPARARTNSRSPRQAQQQERDAERATAS